LPPHCGQSPPRAKLAAQPATSIITTMLANPSFFIESPFSQQPVSRNDCIFRRAEQLESGAAACGRRPLRLRLDSTGSK
jgi:hypothetical protein